MGTEERAFLPLPPGLVENATTGADCNPGPSRPQLAAPRSAGPISVSNWGTGGTPRRFGMGVITSEINEQPRPSKTQGVPPILKNGSALASSWASFQWSAAH